MPETPPLVITIFFVALVFTLVAFLTFATWRTGKNLREAPERTRRWTMGTSGFVIVWLAATAILAARGKLSDWSQFPPPVMKLFTTATLLTIFYAFSHIGSRLVDGLSVASLVGFQAFRIPVEIILFLWFRYQIVPVQMTFEGWNFDVLSGLSACVVAWLAAHDRLPRWGLLLWNVIGLGLLINIVTIAVLSMPTSLRMFFTEPANIIVTTQAPYIWLPVFLVQAALFGHLLVFRKMWRTA